MASEKLRVTFALEAVVCDHCDTFFGVPKYMERRRYVCPLGHPNEARSWPPAPDDDTAPTWAVLQRVAAAAVCEVNPAVERGFVVGFECGHGDYWASYDQWTSHVGESIASELIAVYRPESADGVHAVARALLAEAALSRMLCDKLSNQLGLQ